MSDIDATFTTKDQILSEARRRLKLLLVDRASREGITLYPPQTEKFDPDAELEQYGGQLMQNNELLAPFENELDQAIKETLTIRGKGRDPVELAISKNVRRELATTVYGQRPML